MTQYNDTNLFSSNAAYLEGLYETYLTAPESIDPAWREYFAQLAGGVSIPDIAHTPVQNEFRAASRSGFPRAAPPSQFARDKQVAVLQLINSYRFLGHRQADLDPLNLAERPEIPELSLKFHNLSSDDLDTVFNTGSLFGTDQASLSDILNTLSTTYCGTIGCEYMHITDTAQKRWIQERLESSHGTPEYSADKKRRILDRLTAAHDLEAYLHRKYVGQKRFSLEGGSSLIPLLDSLIEHCGYHGIKEAVMGMAHRGRLNVLVNIFGKSTEILFQEFEGKLNIEHGSGDVKYHKGFSVDLSTAHGPVHAVLAFNPSHLEVINPVVEGSVRARQERRKDVERKQVLPILIHGDAAIAGQGIVMETLNLSETRGYTTGGTVHVVINNQIGFTTSDPLDSRSTLYCTDVAKMVQSPIFHVNGHDPEAVVFITELALDYRMQFKKDVVMDLVCYRRHGHNEADEPSVTQPLMYQRIRNQPPIKELYFRQLLEEGVVEEGDDVRLTERYLYNLEHNYCVSSPIIENPDKTYAVNFSPFINKSWREQVDTSISRERISSLTEKMIAVPNDYLLHRAVKKIIDSRRAMGAGGISIDWGYAEMLAYASLLEDGYPVRLSGQDSVRGTFFHRHAAFHDQQTRRTHVPLQHLYEGQPSFLPINSLLSEMGVLGFEVGYSTAAPNSLVIWEAQFGDFANNAQVMFDQFISSSEAKWQRFCGLVMLLPHGYDGQGPEHSSARLERYLQLCAEDNIQVCVPSTPAQMFHMLRRQMLRPVRKPLIVMSPKSLLRHKLSSSTLADLSESEFKLIIDEIKPVDTNRVKRLLMCAGKVYFDLLEARDEHGLDDVAIIRIEQLYPFPLEEVKAIIARYPRAKEIVWVQEEPRNQGAWYYMQSRRNIRACMKSQHSLDYAGRTYSASPAAGYLHLHLAQQKALIEDALLLRERDRGVELHSIN